MNKLLFLFSLSPIALSASQQEDFLALVSQKLQMPDYITVQYDKNDIDHSNNHSDCKVKLNYDYKHNAVFKETVDAALSIKITEVIVDEKYTKLVQHFAASAHSGEITNNLNECFVSHGMPTDIVAECIPTLLLQSNKSTFDAIKGNGFKIKKREG